MEMDDLQDRLKAFVRKNSRRKEEAWEDSEYDFYKQERRNLQKRIDRTKGLLKRLKRERKSEASKGRADRIDVASQEQNQRTKISNLQYDIDVLKCMKREIKKKLYSSKRSVEERNLNLIARERLCVGKQAWKRAPEQRNNKRKFEETFEGEEERGSNDRSWKGRRKDRDGGFERWGEDAGRQHMTEIDTIGKTNHGWKKMTWTNSREKTSKTSSEKHSAGQESVKTSRKTEDTKVMKGKKNSFKKCVDVGERGQETNMKKKKGMKDVKKKETVIQHTGEQKTEGKKKKETRKTKCVQSNTSFGGAKMKRSPNPGKHQRFLPGSGECHRVLASIFIHLCR